MRIKKRHVLAEISTKGRYHTTLPLAILSVAFQTRPPDKLLIMDDNRTPMDLRDNPNYQYLFALLKEKGIEWEVKFGKQKGQHYNHQIAQEMAEMIVWRLDDDECPEPDTLEKLLKQMKRGVGAVAGLVMDPTAELRGRGSNRMKDIFDKPNSQWFKSVNTRVRKADHLYSSFIYKKGIADYDLRLSPRAFREETIFTHEIKRAGYKLLIDPTAITWHFRFPTGGIRSKI